MPTLQEQINALKTQATGLTRRIVALEAKTVATDTTVAGISNKINALAGNVATLSSNVTGFSSRLDQATRSIGSLGSEITSIKTTIAGLTSGATNAAENAALLAETLDALAAKVVEVEALGEKVAALETEVEALKAQESQTPTEPETPVEPEVPHNLTLRTPVWSGTLKDTYGVCSHPNYMTAVYQNTDAWVDKVKGLSNPIIRGMYSETSPGVKRTVELLRANGGKWLMLVVPEGTHLTPDQVRAKVAHIAANAADICVAVEGLNEPNHNRDDTPVSATWADECVAYQKVIYDAVRSHPELDHVVVLGPSLHDAVSTAQEDYHTLKNKGVLNYMTACGLHCYQGARKPDGEGKIVQRLNWIKSAYGNVPVWITETGYHTGMNVPAGRHQPTPEEVAAVYGPRMIFDMYRLGVAKHFKYELMDDPDAEQDDVEYGFGLVDVTDLSANGWRDKPEYTTMARLLGELTPKGEQTDRKIPLEVEAPADVKWTLVDNGVDVDLYVYRDVSIYDRSTKQALNVGSVDVKVTDKTGTRTVAVGPELVRVAIAA